MLSNLIKFLQLMQVEFQSSMPDFKSPCIILPLITTSICVALCKTLYHILWSQFYRKRNQGQSG
jgi:hypothetical protein